jgi:hypothetical protein
MCQPLNVERPVYTYFPVTLLCTSAQKVTVILFTSYSCHLKISFRCVDVRWLRMYWIVLNIAAHNILHVGNFSYMLLISRHAMKFTCFYKIWFICCFYFPYSKLCSPSDLLSHRTHPKSKCFFGFKIFPTQYKVNQQTKERWCDSL